jgi:hypothetical protein
LLIVTFLQDGKESAGLNLRRIMVVVLIFSGQMGTQDMGYDTEVW